MNRLRAGDLMFGPIGGLAGNLIVGPAQLLLAIAEPGLIWRQGVRKWYGVRHCGIVTPNGRLVQAMPGGVEEIELTAKHWTSQYVYIRPRYWTGQGFDIAEIAHSYIGTPYDFATYGAIPAYRRGLRTERIKRIISDTDTMMCSRLVDASLADAGFHLFDDGRLPGNVTPSEAFRRLLMMPTEMILRPA